MLGRGVLAFIGSYCIFKTEEGTSIASLMVIIHDLTSNALRIVKGPDG